MDWEDYIYVLGVYIYIYIYKYSIINENRGYEFESKQGVYGRV